MLLPDSPDKGIASIRAVAREIGIAVQSDPEPERNRFVHSDHYSFVRAEIPALAMKVGYEGSSPEGEIAGTPESLRRRRVYAPPEFLTFA